MSAPSFLALVFTLYVAVEVVRYCYLRVFENFLHHHRTPLSKGFDREAWGRFMLGALQREASMGPQFVRAWIASTFGAPVESLTRGDIDKCLRMYISTREPIDGPLEKWAESLADSARDVIEDSLQWQFPAGDARTQFYRINVRTRRSNSCEPVASLWP